MSRQTTILDDHYLAFRVRAALREHDTTQTALAQHLDVSEHYLSRRLRGKVPFGAVELAQVAEFLGVPVDHFLAGPPAALGRAS